MAKLILKKKLGQHFLHDENICKKITTEISIKENLNLLEIGPGGGALTKYLLQLKDINYKAIEIDEEKVSYLIENYPSISDKIIHADFLKSPMPFNQKFSIIGNFPYNISSSILFKIIEWEKNIDEVVGMFQKEVALRVASREGSKSYGILSVLIQAFFQVSYLMDVNEQCFTPPPKVLSGVIRLSNINDPFEIKEKQKFINLVKAAFGQRRKTLRNALRGHFPPEILTEDIFNKRAEQLSVSEFVDLYKKKY